jgi:multidrug resistance efflux pump
MIRFSLIAMAAASLLLAACGGSEAQPSGPEAQAAAVERAPESALDQIIGIGQIQPLREILPLTASASGKVIRIAASEGQAVAQQADLVELEHGTESAQLAQAKARLLTQRAAIESQRASAEALQLRLDKARSDHRRNEQLFAGKALTQQALEDSESASKVLEKDLATAQASLRQQEQRLAELEADVEYYNSLISQKYVRAPLAGILLSLDVKLGEYVQPALKLGELAPEGPLMAITEVDELFADRVRLGTRAYLRPQGGRDTLATGKVVYAAPALKKKSLFSDGAANLEDRRVREVHVELAPGSQLLIGSRVECILILE